jgi:hypothetical protein
MAATVEDLTVNWEEDGELRVKEVSKHCLSKGSWATVMFLFQEMDPKTKDYRAPKIGVRRYRKLKGEYKYQSEAAAKPSEAAAKPSEAAAKPSEAAAAPTPAAEA